MQCVTHDNIGPQLCNDWRVLEHFFSHIPAIVIVLRFAILNCVASAAHHAATPPTIARRISVLGVDIGYGQTRAFPFVIDSRRTICPTARGERRAHGMRIGSLGMPPFASISGRVRHHEAKFVMS